MKIHSIDGDKLNGLSVEVVLALAAAFVAGSIGRGKGLPIEQVNGMITGVHQHLIIQSRERFEYLATPSAVRSRRRVDPR
jgi:hypothetical protein